MLLRVGEKHDLAGVVGPEKGTMRHMESSVRLRRRLLSRTHVLLATQAPKERAESLSKEQVRGAASIRTVP